MGGRAAAVGLLALTLTAGCADSGHETNRGPTELAEARLSAPAILEVGVMSCNGDPEITELTEEAHRVGVEVTSTVTDPGDSCMDLVEVVLQDPLGERDLVDVTSGRTLEVTVVGG